MAIKSINGLVTLQYYTNGLHEPAAADHQIRTALIHSFTDIDVSCLLGVSTVPPSWSPHLSLQPALLLKVLGNVLKNKSSLPLQ